MHNIKIGTLVSGDNALNVIPQILPYGFESFSVTFWETALNTDLVELSKKLKETLAPSNAIISSISVFGNPLMDNQKAKDCIKSWETLIDVADIFGTNLVTGFCGRIVDEPVEKSFPKFKEVFGELTKRAESKNVKLAFENCNMGSDWNKGDWNIAYSSKAWEVMFNEVQSDNIGLQWEPCHQMVQLVDPIPQLRKWAKKIFNVHGKDATIAWDIIREKGILCGEEFVWHRTPGFGDTNWTDIISILRMNGFEGSIDIEGFHDPVYRGDLEYTGQVHALNYLKNCRGGAFVPNPKDGKEVRI